MKRFIFCFICALIVGWIFPWWSVFVVGLAAAMIFGGTGSSSFLWGFLGVFLAWFVIAVFLDTQNDSILSTRMAEMFSLPSGMIMVTLSSLIGGLIGGLGGLLGSLVRADYFSPS